MPRKDEIEALGSDHQAALNFFSAAKPFSQRRSCESQTNPIASSRFFAVSGDYVFGKPFDRHPQSKFECSLKMKSTWQ